MTYISKNTISVKIGDFSRIILNAGQVNLQPADMNHKITQGASLNDSLGG